MGTTALADRWAPDGLDRLGGRRAVVTGANGGLGSAISAALARGGASVVLACRNLAKAAPVVDACQALGAGAEARPLDLADLASVRAFCDGMAADRLGIDLLVNNAGVMALPTRSLTADGFEMQFGTNHLGHFALTAGLWPLLRPDARVVTVGSIAAQMCRLDPDDLQSERHYNPMRTYARSKLATVFFLADLDRRLRAAGSDVRSVGGHPGYTSSGILGHTGSAGQGGLYDAIIGFANRVVAQPAALGALPILRAATSSTAHGGDYYSPALELWGPSRHHALPHPARDPGLARRLWEASEQLTGVTLDVRAPRPAVVSK